MLTGSFLWPFLPLDCCLKVIDMKHFLFNPQVLWKNDLLRNWSCVNASTWGTSSIRVCTSHVPVLQWSCHLPLRGSLQLKRTLCNLESSKRNLCGNSWTQIGRITGAKQWSVRSGNANWWEEMQRCGKNSENKNIGTTKGREITC